MATGATRKLIAAPWFEIEHDEMQTRAKAKEAQMLCRELQVGQLHHHRHRGSTNAVYYWIDPDNDERKPWADTFDIEDEYSDEMWVMMITRPTSR